MDFKFYPIVELFWKDHYDLGDEWYDKIPDDGVRIISTVGYLVGEDDDYYYVSCNYDFGMNIILPVQQFLKTVLLTEEF